MKKILKMAALLVLILICWTPPLAAAPPRVGDQLPDITLVAPRDSAEKDYLGWGWGRSFKIPEIKASYVLIQIFSMYCPYCQGDAPHVNELYTKIQASPKLRDRLKVIGIGAGNTVFEVRTFKTRYKVPFPLFPDGDYVIHKQIGEVRTPYFIGVKLNEDGTTRVIYSKLGVLGDADQFLTDFIKLMDLK